jgi:2-alkenal reductase
MKWTIRLLFFLLLVPAIAEKSLAQALTQTEKLRVEVFRRAAPSVVHVAVKKTSDEQPDSKDEYGTGFLWDRMGHVVTNTHVIRGAQNVVVVMPSGKVVPTKVVGLAPYYDIAVLQIYEMSDPPPIIPLGDSSSLQVGQSVYAIGSPFGLDQTLTTGVVSALKRRTRVDGRHEIADAIQIDAATNPGNSGGPLLDSTGHLIGITTSIVSSSGTWSGVGFSIPVATVKRVVPELIQTGHASVPGIGIIAAPDSKAAIEGVHGVVIARVIPNSPAERAGLKGSAGGTPGDVIIAADQLAVTRLADLYEAVEMKGVGRSIELTVLRQGQLDGVGLEIVDESIGSKQ